MNHSAHLGLPSGGRVTRLWTNRKFEFEVMNPGDPREAHVITLSMDDVEALYRFATGRREELAAQGPGRKVVQVCAHPFPLRDGATGDVFVVVCDDGTMWWRTMVAGVFGSWELLPGPP